MEKKIIEQVYEQQVTNSEIAFKNWNGEISREAKINGFKLSFNKDKDGNFQFFQITDADDLIPLTPDKEQANELIKYIIERSSLERLQSHKKGFSENKIDFDQVKKTNSKIPKNIDDYKDGLNSSFIEEKEADLEFRKAELIDLLANPGLKKGDEKSPERLQERDYQAKFAEITEELRQQAAKDKNGYILQFNEDGTGALRDPEIESFYSLKIDKKRNGDLSLKYSYLDDDVKIIKDANVPLAGPQQEEAKSHLKTIHAHSSLSRLKSFFEEDSMLAIDSETYEKLREGLPSLPENMEDAKKLLTSEHFDALEEQAIESRKALHDLARDNLKLERLENVKPQVKDAREAWDILTEAYATKKQFIDIKFPDDSNSVQQFFGKQKIKSLSAQKDDLGQITFTYINDAGQEGNLKLTNQESADLFRMMAKENAYQNLARFANGDDSKFAEMKAFSPELGGAETLRKTLKDSGNFKTTEDLKSGQKSGPLDQEAHLNLRNIATLSRDGMYSGVSSKNKLFIAAGVIGGIGLIGADAIISLSTSGHPPQIMAALGNLAGMALNYWRDMKQDGRINRTDQRAIEMQAKMNEQLLQFKETHKTELAAKDSELAKLTAMVEKMMVNATKAPTDRPKDEVQPGADQTRDAGANQQSRQASRS